VGLSVAVGLRLSLGVPALGVDSLRAQAAAAFLTAEGRLGAPVLAPGQVLLPARDARRDEVFVAGYDAALALVLPVCALPRASAGEELARLLAGRQAWVVGPELPEMPRPGSAEGARALPVDELDFARACASAVALLASARRSAALAFEQKTAAAASEQKTALPTNAPGADDWALTPLYVRGPDVVRPVLPPSPLLLERS